MDCFGYSIFSSAISVIQNVVPRGLCCTTKLCPCLGDIILTRFHVPTMKEFSVRVTPNILKPILQIACYVHRGRINLTRWLKCRYQGPYLLDAIDSLQPPTRDFSKPLLMPICDVIKPSSSGQVSACGKLEAGALRSGFKVRSWVVGLVSIMF